LPVYGQSESLGYESAPVLTTANKYSNLMFSSGARPEFDGVVPTYGSLVPLVEGPVETPLSGASEMQSQVQPGVAVQYLCAAQGWPGVALAYLQKGGDAIGHCYANLMAELLAGYNFAKAAGKSFRSSGLIVLHGAGDTMGTPRATYLAQLIQLFTDWESDLAQVTTQPSAPVRVVGQTASQLAVAQDANSVPLVSLAQWDAFRTGVIHALVPQYQYDYWAPATGYSFLHHPAIDGRRLGAALGLARLQASQGINCTLYPTSFTRSGNVATIAFHVPVGNLTIDNSWLTANDCAGVDIVDGSGTLQTVSSFQVMNGNQLQITLSGAVPAGAVARGGWRSNVNGGLTINGRAGGGRLNLRDQQGDSVVFDPTGTNFRMDNWCPIFDLTCSN
jgi:hypothetical protein